MYICAVICPYDDRDILIFRGIDIIYIAIEKFIIGICLMGGTAGTVIAGIPVSQYYPTVCPDIIMIIAGAAVFNAGVAFKIINGSAVTACSNIFIRNKLSITALGRHQIIWPI